MITNDTSFNVSSGVPLKSSAETIDEKRRAQENGSLETTSEDTTQIAPEELLDEIKALTENGSYSVRFEKNDTTNDMIIKIVDQDSDEIVRQFPAEEVLSIRESLSSLRGNIINTVR